MVGMTDLAYHRMPLDARVRLVSGSKCLLERVQDDLSMLISDAVNAGFGASEATTRMANVLADLRPALQKLRTVSALLPHEQTERGPARALAEAPR